jgi:hypothetical protein
VASRTLRVQGHHQRSQREARYEYWVLAETLPGGCKQRVAAERTGVELQQAVKRSVSHQRLRLFVYQTGYELVRLERRQILLRTVKDSPEERLAALREMEQSALFFHPYDPCDRAHDEHFQPRLAKVVAGVQALPDSIPGQRYFPGGLRKQLAPTKPAAR